ncbi:MAG: MBL fold metallo-hydrolase [Chloroflexi bacterium]|nr:MBL fold metallo-hydrolase [Chloroflexota bacterium]
MEVLYNRGLYFPFHDLWMDSTLVKDFCMVSHGHSDHTARHRKVLATPGTARILRARDRVKSVIELPYNTPWETDSYRVTLHPAGHCLGSAQMLMEMEDTDERLVYTGDFKLRPNGTAETAPIIPCDALIIDATYGHPRYTFPPDEEVLDRLCAFVDRALNDGAVPVVLGYALGKSQEVLKVLVQRGYQVSAHKDIYAMAQIYEQEGVSFGGEYMQFEGEDLRGRVLIAPPHRRTAPEIARIPRRREVMISGWGIDRSARFRFKVDEVLPFSDHADFPTLLRYVQESGARRIYTVFGFPDLAARLQAEGYEAHHLQPHQMMLPI